jgi:excinuclease ABC subunit A
MLVCVTGVSGSGKSTLVDDILRRALFRHFYDSKEKPGQHKAIKGLDQLDKVIVIDQSPIGRTPRSNPATYTGAFNLIRDLFAKLPGSKVRGLRPRPLQLQREGRAVRDLQGRRHPEDRDELPARRVRDVRAVRGRRYNRETLEVKYNGKSIADVLDLTIDEALDSSRTSRHRPQAAHPVEVGLGYLQVGQPRPPCRAARPSG